MDTLLGDPMVEAGRRLGHDIFRLTRTPPRRDWPGAVQEGFGAAQVRGIRRGHGDRFQRKWLQLRLGALRRGRPVADNVTVALLRRLDLTHCPVTRRPLTHGAQGGSDWSIDRLNNDGAYAASNLAVLSTDANRAKGTLGLDEVLERAQRSTPANGLAPREWQRLACLMVGPAFAGRQDLAPVLPLCAPLPACSVRPALQQIQQLLTVQAHRPAGKNALVRDLRPACGDERTLLLLKALADSVHEGLKRLRADEACWDVWLQPEPMAALIRWRESLDERAWCVAAVISGRLAGATRVTGDSLSSWRLPTRGYLNETDGLASARPPWPAANLSARTTTSTRYS